MFHFYFIKIVNTLFYETNGIHGKGPFRNVHNGFFRRRTAAFPTFRIAAKP
jgi:hypothetical protein